MTTQSKKTTIDKLISFVNRRPGLDFCNYGDLSAYRSESRGITKDRQDFFELFALASRRCENLEKQLTDLLSNSPGRLTMKDGDLEYCTGQYFPTEYRPAANNILKTLIWDSYRNEKNEKGEPVYKDGDQIRKAIRRNLSRRATNNYFN